MTARTAGQLTAADLGRSRALVSDWQANAGSRALGDPTAATWNEAARQLLDALPADTPVHVHDDRESSLTAEELADLEEGLVQAQRDNREPEDPGCQYVYRNLLTNEVESYCLLERDEHRRADRHHRYDREPDADDGLCHAYREYGLDCLQPAGHDGSHGDREPDGEEVRRGAR